MRLKRERRRTDKDLVGMAYYAFGGKCYHRLRRRPPEAIAADPFHLSGTVCGHEIDHIDPNPQRVWRSAPEAYVRHDYKPCPICYGRNYVYKPE